MKLNIAIKPIVSAMVYCLFSYVLSAQSGREHLYNKASVDSLTELGFALTSNNTTESKQVSQQALNIARKINYSFGRVNALINFSILNRNSGNYSIAQDNLKEALKISFEKNDNVGIAKSYYYLGDLNKVLGNFEKAKMYFTKSYELFRHTTYKELENKSVSNLAHSHMDQAIPIQDTNGYKTAINIYKKALALAKDMKDRSRITIAYVNLSNAYNYYGLATKNNNHFATAIFYSILSYREAKINNNNVHLAISLNNIGEVMESLHNYPKALYYLNEALRVYEKAGNKERSILVNTRMGRIYQTIGNLNTAKDHILRSVELAQEQNMKKSLHESYLLLSKLYESANQYSKALFYSNLSNNYKDSLLAEREAITLKGLQIEFESDRKDKEIILLNKNKEVQAQQLRIQTIYRNGLIIGCVFLFLTLVLLFYRYREKQKTEKQILHAKNEAEKARLMQEQFLANTSHEIRTPMNGIIGMTGQLQATTMSAQQLEYVNAINESANSLLVIINDLLDYSKIKSGKITFYQSPFRLNDLFKNLTYNFEGKCKEKKLHWSALVDSQIPSVIIGDRVRLQQILLNLVSNAVKFTDKGEVKLIARYLSSEKGSVQIEFSVIDTGSGIPSDEIDSVFESFRQLDAKTNRKHGGTGLGLSITKQLVEQMGGQIHVSSKEKQGSTFSFSLRFGRKVSAKKNPPVVESTSQLKFENTAVLIVDDNKINRQVAQLSLQKWNVASHLASGAKEAFEILAGHHKIDLILMDISMPGMDGFEATKYIRENFPPSISQLPIVAMTASAFTGDREKCLSLGMNDYISKPFKPTDLYEIIRRNLPHAKYLAKQITNLDHLNDKADGDQSFLIDIMQTYVAEMPVYIDELKQALSSGDAALLKAQAHKMKSPVALFGAQDLKNDLQNIEVAAINGNDKPQLENMVNDVCSLCLKSVEEVRKELERLLLLPVK